MLARVPRGLWAGALGPRLLQALPARPAGRTAPHQLAPSPRHPLPRAPPCPYPRRCCWRAGARWHTLWRCGPASATTRNGRSRTPPCCAARVGGWGGREVEGEARAAAAADRGGATCRATWRRHCGVPCGCRAGADGPCPAPSLPLRAGKFYVNRKPRTSTKGSYNLSAQQVGGRALARMRRAGRGVRSGRRRPGSTHVQRRLQLALEHEPALVVWAQNPNTRPLLHVLCSGCGTCLCSRPVRTSLCR